MQQAVPGAGGDNTGLGDCPSTAFDGPPPRHSSVSSDALSPQIDPMDPVAEKTVPDARFHTQDGKEFPIFPFHERTGRLRCFFGADFPAVTGTCRSYCRSCVKIEMGKTPSRNGTFALALGTPARRSARYSAVARVALARGTTIHCHPANASQGAPQSECRRHRDLQSEW